MAALFKPTPCVAIGDIIDGGAGDAIIRRYCVLAFPCGKPSLYFASHLVGDFGSGIPLASIVRPMKKRVGYVLRARCPSQMGWVYAAAMAVTARMRGVMAGSRWRTIGALTDESRSEVVAPINGNTSVSFDAAIRPENTLVGGRCQRKAQERQEITFGCSPTDRVSMTPVSLPMRNTPSSAIVRLAAIWDRAYSLVSHFDLRERLNWLERVAVLEAPGAFAFCTTKTSRCKP